MGLAYQLLKTAKVCIRSVLPHANRTFDTNYEGRHFDLPIQGSLECAFHVDSTRDTGGHDYCSPPCGDGTGSSQAYPPCSYPPNDHGGPSHSPSGADAPCG
jgi:hypothetical protein